MEGSCRCKPREEGREKREGRGGTDVAMKEREGRGWKAREGFATLVS